MKKGKFVRVSLALLALTMILSACGSGAASTPAATTTTTAVSSAGTTTAAPADSGGINTDELMEVTIAIRGTGYTQEGSQIQKYFEEKYNVKMNFIVIPGPPDGNSKVNLLMADEKQRPDVIWWLGMDMDYAKWRNAGLLVDITEYYNKYHEIKDYYEKVSPDTMFFSQEADGTIYRIPGDVSEPGTYTTLMRKDWMEKLNISTPTTLDEYADALRKMTFEDPDGNNVNDTYGFGGQGLDFTAFQPFWSAFEAIPSNFIRKADGSIVYGATQPEVKEALAYIQALYKEGVIDPSLMTQNEYNTEFVRGGHGSVYRWVSWMNVGGTTNKTFRANNPGAEFVALDPIQSASGYSSDAPGAAKAWSHFGITNVAKDPERIYAMLDDMVNSENWIIRQFGFENEQYKIENGLYASLLEGDQNVKENIGVTLFRDYVNRKDEANIANSPDVVALFNKRAETSRADYARICYFKTVDLPVWQAYGSELEKLRDEYIWGILSGSRPIDDFDKFVDLFYASGGKEAEAEAAEVMAAQDAEYANYNK